MALGLPVVGLATTEMGTVVRNGVNGYVEVDRAKLVVIDRFVRDWAVILRAQAGRSASERAAIGLIPAASASGCRSGNESAEVPTE